MQHRVLQFCDSYTLNGCHVVNMKMSLSLTHITFTDNTVLSSDGALQGQMTFAKH